MSSPTLDGNFSDRLLMRGSLHDQCRRYANCFEIRTGNCPSGVKITGNRGKFDILEYIEEYIRIFQISLHHVHFLVI